MTPISPRIKLDRKAIIKAALGGRKLNAAQTKAIDQIVYSYSSLISASLTLPPDKKDVEVFTESIRAGILNILLILENYVQPRQSKNGSKEITGES